MVCLKFDMFGELSNKTGPKCFLNSNHDLRNFELSDAGVLLVQVLNVPVFVVAVIFPWKDINWESAFSNLYVALMTVVFYCKKCNRIWLTLYFKSRIRGLCDHKRRTLKEIKGKFYIPH